MQCAPLASRNAALAAIKAALIERRDAVTVANKRDVEESARDGVADALAKVCRAGLVTLH